ncbi:MAG: hypothetical protein C4321_07625 [Chloroflexota bacterium]
MTLLELLAALGTIAGACLGAYYGLKWGVLGCLIGAVLGVPIGYVARIAAAFPFLGVLSILRCILAPFEYVFERIESRQRGKEVKKR